jgi:hypothetical protein
MYSLQDLAKIFNSKYTLTKDRFLHYFTLRYNYSEREASEAYQLYSQFSKGIYNEKQSAVLDKIIPKALFIFDELQDGWDKKRDLKIGFCEKSIKKLIYKINGKSTETIFDFYDPNDIITYAAILQNANFEIIALLSLSCEIKEKETTYIFVGDIFNTNDKFWGDESNVYVARENGYFQRLLYIKGKGYVRSGNELNYEEEKEYTDYVLRLNDYTKIGNISIDYSMLTD